jgi:hypothetical protein
MAMPPEGHGHVVLEREVGPLRCDETAEQGATQARGHLDVTQRRNPEIRICLLQDGPDRRRSISLQQVLEQRRGIGHDRSQSSSLSARSSRMS